MICQLLKYSTAPIHSHKNLGIHLFHTHTKKCMVNETGKTSAFVGSVQKAADHIQRATHIGSLEKGNR